MQHQKETEKMTKHPTLCFYHPTLHWCAAEGITAASPGGCFCQGHQKLEKGSKNELKNIKELDIRSYNEKLQNFKIEK